MVDCSAEIGKAFVGQKTYSSADARGSLTLHTAGKPCSGYIALKRCANVLLTVMGSGRALRTMSG